MQGCSSYSLMLRLFPCVKVAMHFRTTHLLNLYAAQVVIHAHTLSALHAYWHWVYYLSRSIHELLSL